MRTAGKALNLTLIIVKTMGTKQCIANSTHQAQRKGKVLPCGPRTTSSISGTWKHVGNSNAWSLPRQTKTETLEVAPKSVLQQKSQMILMPTAVWDPLIWRQGNRLPFTGGAIWGPPAVTGYVSCTRKHEASRGLRDESQRRDRLVQGRPHSGPRGPGLAAASSAL